MAVCLTAFLASGVTLFSGFGLGTILMPVMALFFPLDIAIAMTAIVHLLNNLFKLILLGKHADKNVLLKFGLPALLFAIAGAFLLNELAFSQPLYNYTIFEKSYNIIPVKLVMGLIILLFAVFEGLPEIKQYTFDKKYLPLGGALSGFFGGLSGHQGALRSAFLVKAGLTKESFIGTGVVIACMVDFTRISVYSVHFSSSGISENLLLIILAALSAFIGVFTANKILKKITMKTVQTIVAFMLVCIGILLTMGII